MVDITPLIRADSKVIQSYRGGRFKISGEVYDRPVIVTADQVLEWDIEINNTSFDSFYNRSFVDHLKKSLPKEHSVVLIGTGAKFQMPGSSDIMRYSQETLRGVEFMDSGAASRTYNVLLAEGRDVAAALLPFTH